MPLDLWFRDDVVRILASTYEAQRSSSAFRRDRSPGAQTGGEDACYEQGFCDALRALALAFGVVWPSARAALLQPDLLPQPVRRQPAQRADWP
jgi:hypothetical protein